MPNIDRRRFIGSWISSIAGIAWYRALPAGAEVASAQLGERPKVHEVTIATPDIIRIEVREAPLRRGRIVKLAAPSTSAHGTWINVGDTEWGVVIGPERDHVRIADYANFDPLDRATVDQPSGYGALGDRHITAVYRKSVPWNSGTVKGGKVIASFAHFMYLKLDAPLSLGEYSVQWPDNVLPPTQFIFDFKVTRSSSIRATQLGHRADDASKYAYLALWLPGGPDDGAIDFRRYGLDEFQIIDGHGYVVFNGSITLRVGPKDRESGSGVDGDILTYTRTNGTTYQANRAGTYVFGLDYSAWRGAPPGVYRIAIPNLGTSDPFTISDDIWYRAAKASMAGLYNQRSGMALDGRFGYVRPECFTEASGVVVRQSRLPLAFIDGGGGFIEFSRAAKPPWITDEVVPDAWGGYQDAGNWPRNIIHIKASYLLLDVYEQLSPPSRNAAFGTPASEEVLRHPLYQGKKFPDLLNEAIWNLDFFRRLQRSDGAVRGGIDSAGFPKQLEPSWLESHLVFAYAPDPGASFVYAAGAAKVAIVLAQLNETGLADLYRDSAFRAWDWAERALADSAGGFGDVQSLLGLPDADFERRLKPILQKVSDSRLWAAASLFRLSGQDRFNRIALDRLNGSYGGSATDAAWEYANSLQVGADTAVQEKIRRDIVAFARNNVVRSQQMHVSYRNMKHLYAPMGWGSGLAPTHEVSAALMRAHRITGEDDFLAAMLDGSAHILGANQIGLSFTVGVGARWPTAPLHGDSIAAGVQPPTGITIYGWATPAMMESYWYIWGPPWAVLSDQVPTKRVEPKRASLPLYEYLIQYPGLVASAEYTVHQTIATTAAVWSYLNGRQAV
ncbi:MAG: glycoside hydrolase family 9 protein [Formivibrio sp.]|nr:glycoside hydrolase family 9 protein [Formivibrio sp.]